MDEDSPPWNGYFLWLVAVLSISSLVSMVAHIPQDAVIPDVLLITRNFFGVVGSITTIVFWSSGRREKKLRKLAKEFGLAYDGLSHSVLATNDPWVVNPQTETVVSKTGAVLNKLRGRVGSHDILIEDRQKLFWLPLPKYGGLIAARKTLIFKDQVEERITSPFSRFVPVYKLRRWLRDVQAQG